MVQWWESSLRDALVDHSASKSHLGKLRAENYIEGSSTQVCAVLEAGVALQSSSHTPAGQPLCRAGWLLVLLPSPLKPFPGGYGGPFAGWVTSAECSAHCSLL